MKVAIMYSGGKDSNYAVKHALDKGWDIAYLLSVKPSRTDCFLFHFATVEHTPLQAEALGLKHYLLGCDVADPVQEAEIVRAFVVAHELVDAVVLGGTGLQATQIRSIQQALLPHGVEVFAAHSGEDHFDVFKRMLADGFEIMITQVASDGLPGWLGKTITKENLSMLEADSRKYGFHVGGEGGYFDSLVLNGPTFNKRIAIAGVQNVMEDQYSGHVLIAKAALADKISISSQ
jgi:diphthine-ammonia ligase